MSLTTPDTYMADDPAGDFPIVQLLTPEGERVSHPEFAYDGDDESIRELYRDLVLMRRVDFEAHALQRHGEIGLWPPAQGQEAAQIGSGRALRKQDFAFPTYREHGVALCRGVEPGKLVGLFRGTELGGWDPNEHGIALYSIVIGAQTLHATGYAMGLTLDGAVGHNDPDRDAAVIAYFGDGATSQGSVNEAFDWAAVFNAPVVFFCQNNQYAISASTDRQTRGPIAQRAGGFGFRGMRVDGNDVLACHAVTKAALQKARDGEGPTLIEAYTYRMGAHTTSDDPTRYRETAEVETWKLKDPIERVKRYLQVQGTPQEFFDALDAEAEVLGKNLREACKALPEPDLEALFSMVYVDGETPELLEQKAAYVAFRDGLETEGTPA
ncbi:pyruvate dehydrogenase E1 component alpha subunit [Aeromicrobium panaciterrae]|uniref:Pyruvate dehydrogenase E1 component alpha subunit n=1 Tax=Aeromicrobium panaciterrae TaxID=363861 RepID=A0ABU1UKE8_9ACTN|nr:pyruvate dehydrogenase (acetyl-transferring) E1 component subunit alpha [Aeromicrobium panaciterrae]MDR7085653.1 pyruvate dehydrogenase E1 component alpha subunit [Aeromicrobium panaciterrae]